MNTLEQKYEASRQRALESVRKLANSIIGHGTQHTCLKSIGSILAHELPALAHSQLGDGVASDLLHNLLTESLATFNQETIVDDILKEEQASMSPFEQAVTQIQNKTFDPASVQWSHVITLNEHELDELKDQESYDDCADDHPLPPALAAWDYGDAVPEWEVLEYNTLWGTWITHVQGSGIYITNDDNYGATFYRMEIEA